MSHPSWIPKLLTRPAAICYTVCPDTAIPGLVSTLSDVLETVLKRVKKNHGNVEILPKAVRQMESHIRTAMNQPKNGATVNTYINHAISKMISESNGDENVVKRVWMVQKMNG